MENELELIKKAFCRGSKILQGEQEKMFFDEIETMALARGAKIEDDTLIAWERYLIEDLEKPVNDVDFMDFINGVKLVGKSTGKFPIVYGDIFEKAKEIRNKRPSREVEKIHEERRKQDEERRKKFNGI
jgi:hypothetical protein